jgi:hypothetical protein
VTDFFPGEDPATTSPEDADHWCEVYEELLSFLDATRSELARDGQGMARGTRVWLADRRYRSRRRYWQLRRSLLLLQKQHESTLEDAGRQHAVYRRLRSHLDRRWSDLAG